MASWLVRRREFVLFAVVVLCAVLQVQRLPSIAETLTPEEAKSNKIDPAVIVSSRSYNNKEPWEIVASNVSFVNALFAEHLRTDEIAPDALRSYYVDYYLAQVNNGGFSQFIWNSKWPPEMIRLIREGLTAMKAKEHLKLFDEIVATVERMGSDRLQAYLASDYFAAVNPQRAALNKDNRRFFQLSDTENLTKLNAAWLRGLPKLEVRTIKEMKVEIERRVAALPDRAERKRAALASEPRYVKLIRKLSEKAGHELSRVTAGDPTHKFNGKAVLAWHFLTNRGHYYMVESDGRAFMFDANSKNKVVEIEVPK